MKSMLMRRIINRLENIATVATTKNPKIMRSINYERNYDKVKKYYTKHPEESINYKKELEYLDNNYPYIMQCRKNSHFENSIRDELSTITYDKGKEAYYIIYKTKEIYFPKDMHLADCVKYWTSVRFEQSENSPHKYLSDKVSIEKNDIVFDIGTAEGLFTIDALNKGAKKVFCFESDSKWIESLNNSFKGDERVIIVDKFVTNNTSADRVCLDEYSSELKNESVFIKMDIEGEEEKALMGGQKLFSSVKKLKFAICTYHKEDDSERIMKILCSENTTCEWSNGYMLVLGDMLKPPYFRHGVLRGLKEGAKNL